MKKSEALDNIEHVIHHYIQACTTNSDGSFVEGIVDIHTIDLEVLSDNILDQLIDVGLVIPPKITIKNHTDKWSDPFYRDNVWEDENEKK